MLFLFYLMRFNVKDCFIMNFVYQERKERVKKTKKYFKRAEAYVKEFRLKERDEIRLARNAKKAGDFYIPPEPKLAFIIRIRGYVINTIILLYNTYF